MIQLQRTIEIQAYDVEGTIARSQQRPELLAVARLAHDSPGGLTPEILANELIGSQPVLCRRILDRCVSLGLLERTHGRGPAHISELGATMLNRGEIWIPEQGAWRVYFTDDPLIDVAVIHVAPCPASKAREERSALRRKSGEMTEQSVASPRVLADQGSTPCTSLVDGSTFQVLDVAKRGGRGPISPLQLQLEYRPGTEAQVTLSGRLQPPAGPPLEVEQLLGVPQALTAWTYDELWTDLVSIAEDLEIEILEAACQRAGQRVLPVGFERTPEAARRQFALDLDIPPTSYDDLGEFQSTRIEAVDIIPRTTEDAARWALWLQWDELDSYRIPAQLRDAAARIRQRFPLFQVQLESPTELLARATAAPDSAHARNLLTPADLGLWS